MLVDDEGEPFGEAGMVTFDVVAIVKVSRRFVAKVRTATRAKWTALSSLGNCSLNAFSTILSRIFQTMLFCVRILEDDSLFSLKTLHETDSYCFC